MNHAVNEQDNLRIAHEIVAAINAHDASAFTKHLDRSFLQESETSGKLHGSDAAHARMTTLLQAFPDLHVTIENAMTSGDQVMLQLHYTGTQTGNFAGVAATNKKVSWHACVVQRMKNGKAAEARLYADNLTLFGQLGVVQIPKAATAG